MPRIVNRVGGAGGSAGKLPEYVSGRCDRRDFGGIPEIDLQRTIAFRGHAFRSIECQHIDLRSLHERDRPDADTELTKMRKLRRVDARLPRCGMGHGACRDGEAENENGTQTVLHGLTPHRVASLIAHDRAINTSIRGRPGGFRSTRRARRRDAGRVPSRPAGSARRSRRTHGRSPSPDVPAIAGTGAIAETDPRFPRPRNHALAGRDRPPALLCLGQLSAGPDRDPGRLPSPRP